jgi:hypothetical protein
VSLNLGMARLARGDSAGAAVHLARGVAGAGGYEKACALVGLPGSASQTEDEVQRVLRRALQAAATQGPEKSGHAPGARGSGISATPAPGSGTNRFELKPYWCWIE